MKKQQIVLFTGLTFFLIAFLFRLINIYPVMIWVFMGLGIMMKVSFLVMLFKEEGFKMTAGLYLILTGVAIILISSFLKRMEWWPMLATVLFYSAIICKVTGVSMVLYRKAVRRKKFKIYLLFISLCRQRNEPKKARATFTTLLRLLPDTTQNNSLRSDRFCSLGV